MTSKNMWGDLQHLPTDPSPRSVLQEQAQLLTQGTNGLLTGKVEQTISLENEFTYDLKIELSQVDNYAYTVLSISYTVKFYPVRVKSDFLVAPRKCDDEDAFKHAIASILGSAGVKAVVARLLSQAT